MAKFIIEVELDIYTDKPLYAENINYVVDEIQKALEKEMPGWKPVARCKSYAQGQSLGYPDSI